MNQIHSVNFVLKLGKDFGLLKADPFGMPQRGALHRQPIHPWLRFSRQESLSHAPAEFKP
jgi:hypothetical protein